MDGFGFAAPRLKQIGSALEVVSLRVGRRCGNNYRFYWIESPVIWNGRRGKELVPMFRAVTAAFLQAGRRRHSFTVRMSAAPQAATRGPRSQCRMPIKGLGGFAYR